jgi:hypothetical protein
MVVALHQWSSLSTSLNTLQRNAQSLAYSLSTLVELEPFIDSTIAVLFSRLDETFTSSEEACDLGECLQFFDFDVIGKFTFSKHLGFLEHRMWRAS